MPRHAGRALQGSMYSAQAAAAAAQSASTAGVGSHAQHVRASMPAARGSLCFFRKTGDRSLARPHVHSFDSARQERVEYVCCEYQLVVLSGQGVCELPSRKRSELARVEVPLVQVHGLRQAQAWPDPRSRGVPCPSEPPLSGPYLHRLDSTSGEGIKTSTSNACGGEDQLSRLALPRVLSALELCQGAADSWYQSLVSLR